MNNLPTRRDGGHDTIARRSWLKQLGLGAAGAAAAVAAGPAAVGAPAADQPQQQPQARRKRSLRIAHLTDCHVQPELKADQGLVACLRHVQSQADKPELVINTGDCVMDAMKQDRARTQLQWDLWHKIWRDECSLPVENCIGNHDVWGWNKKRSKTTGEEAEWGKQWAMDALGLGKPFRSFDRGGWHFVVLDSVHPFRDAYTALLGERQHEWLAADLAATDAKTPVLVMSHIPIFSVTPFMVPECEAGGDRWIKGPTMHVDARRIKDLFKKHPNVKACVSGHIHLVDRVEYLGVTYLCDGAVSGDWWKGSRLGECDPGYALIDLYDDGSVEREYVTYGWVAAGAQEARAPAHG